MLLRLHLHVKLDDAGLPACSRTNNTWHTHAQSCAAAELRRLQLVFFLETAFGSLLRKGYFLRMYFWIDFTATFSMFFDIALIVNKMGGAAPLP